MSPKERDASSVRRPAADDVEAGDQRCRHPRGLGRILGNQTDVSSIRAHQ
jgi:hypothetical protein